MSDWTFRDPTALENSVSNCWPFAERQGEVRQQNKLRAGCAVGVDELEPDTSGAYEMHRHYTRRWM